jgi:hypothetical protein
MREPIDGVSFNSIQIYALNTSKPTTTVSIRKPSEVKPSDPPLNTQGGKYKIACPDLIDHNVIHRTSEIDIFSGAGTIDEVLQRYIPWMAFKIRVTMPNAGYPSDKNGLQILIHMLDFDHFPFEIPQCHIEGEAPPGASEEHEHPIKADASFIAEKRQERGTNLVFDPIPMEMLYTPARKPQVLVTVNGLAAVCPKQNCDYSYVPETPGKITGVELTGQTVKIKAKDLVAQECDVEDPN